MSEHGWLSRTILAVAAACLVAGSGPPPQQRTLPPEQRTSPPEQRALPAGQSAAVRPAERRVAMVVGNSAYRNTSALANPSNDARDMAKALERTGFEVILALDATKPQMDSALRAFADKLGGADVALFYYAGHGLQVGSQNYLVPVEARLASERDLDFEATKLDFVLRQMEIDRDGKTTIVMLDACRDNPLTRSLARSMGTRSAAIGRGLAPASTGVGTFIAYSTQPGNVALDGQGRNSPFTTALLAHIGEAGNNLNATMIEVRRSVIRATGGRQVPWDHSALTGDFYFVPPAPQTGAERPPPVAGNDDVAALKARLQALEDAEKRRASDGDVAGGRSPASAGLPAGATDIVRLAEMRARLAVAEDKTKDLMSRLLEARRVEGQARDAVERQRLVRDSLRIQTDMTKASREAKALREQIAALVPSPASAGQASAIDLAASRTERGYGIYEAAGIAGDKIKFGAADSVAGCLSTCSHTPGCVAGEFTSAGSRQSSCSVYRHVIRLQSGPSDTTAFVKSGLTRTPGPPPVLPKAP